MSAADPLSRLLLGSGPSGYGAAQVQPAVCTAWDPVTLANTVTDGAATWTNLPCIAPSLMGAGRVLLLNTPGRPVLLGLLYTPAIVAGGDTTGSGGGGGGATALTRLGWSGDDAIPSVRQDVKGTWMVRDSWANMAAGNYLTEGTYATYVSSFPARSVDIGVPLIPHDSVAETGWNALLDEVVAGTHDGDHFLMGQKIAQHSTATVYARLWWEMNMSTGNLDFVKFKNAWNRAVPNIRAGFASTATTGQTLNIVFCYLPDRDTQGAMYPDGANVDIVGSDIYGKKFQSVTPTSTELLDYINGQLTALTQFGADRGKPTSLGEWGNWHVRAADGVTDSRGLGDFPAYIDAVFDWIVATTPAYTVYFNIADGGVGQRLIDTPNSLARYQARAAALQT